MTNKVAYLVLGPESSGNRLLTRILMACGCEGDPDHFQRFDDSLEGAGNKIVWRRSVPHDTKWDEAEKVLAKCMEAGYSVRVFVIIRSFYCTAKSQVKEGHATTLEQAKEHITKATRLIGSFVANNDLPVRYVTYEEIVNHLESLLRSLVDWDLHCDLLILERILDRNQQYLTGVCALASRSMTDSASTRTLGLPTTVRLTEDHVPPNNKKWIRAFVKTNGSSKYIFTSLSENGSAHWPRAVFSAPRPNGNDRGILICVVFNEENTSPDWAIEITVSQQDATEYGPPVLYLGN